MAKLTKIALFPLTCMIAACGWAKGCAEAAKDVLEKYRKFLFNIRDELEQAADEWMAGYLADDAITLDAAQDEYGSWNYPGKFARLVAQRAYFQFGVRNYNKANRLVTRKWIRNLLDGPEYRDLRLKDKIAVIDEALVLSFVPSKTWERTYDYAETEVFKNTVPHGESSPL
nr:MAG: hypothetical protein [Sanya tombus-like virus 1]UUW21057.1 MAG: hypothetical protein [Sanya tombus-like virus 1]UUW21060.1 MAG: hypothetical protein [Sanya tombus-like virus 1]UUW21063.1 MAG: hypothetical protein [Sanya tombus-like virus 1]UUW21066.1 MAG: hypothetical protein [Sanya tombus-like virus 1]